MIDSRYWRLSSAHADAIHAQLLKMDWNKEEIRRRTGLDRARIRLFVEKKYASAMTGARIATAIAAGLAERGGEQCRPN